MTPTNDWITDRRPTEADGDEDGEVVLRRFADGRRDSTLGKREALVDWRHIGKGVPWKRTDIWQPPATSEPTPRKFASLTRTITDFGHIIDAIDEDGVAWWMGTASDADHETKWQQLLPLPGREVPA